MSIIWISGYKELGDYFLNDSGKVQMPEQWKAGIDKEDFGFNAALHEDGKLTDYGYIARSGTDWKEVYAGQETPEKYRIMGYPEAERPAPEQDEKEAAPAVDIAAANPIRPRIKIAEVHREDKRDYGQTGTGHTGFI